MRAAGRNGGRPVGDPKPDLARSWYNLVAGVSSRRVSVLPLKPRPLNRRGFAFQGIWCILNIASVNLLRKPRPLNRRGLSGFWGCWWGIGTVPPTKRARVAGWDQSKTHNLAKERSIRSFRTHLRSANGTPCSARYLLVVRTAVDFSKQAPVPKHTCPARQRHSADGVLLADCKPGAGVQLPRKGERSFRSAREECT